MRTTNEWLDWAKNEHRLSNDIMSRTHSLDYDFATLPPKLRKAVADQIKGALDEFAGGELDLVLCVFERTFERM